MASTAGRVSLLVAGSISAVEALKDQAGLCHWNYALQSLQQRAKGQFGSFSQATATRTSMDAARTRRRDTEEKAKKSEVGLRTVMYLSCWGPN